MSDVIIINNDDDVKDTKNDEINRDIEEEENNGKKLEPSLVDIYEILRDNRLDIDHNSENKFENYSLEGNEDKGNNQFSINLIKTNRSSLKSRSNKEKRKTLSYSRLKKMISNSIIDSKNSKDNNSKNNIDKTNKSTIEGKKIVDDSEDIISNTNAITNIENVIEILDNNNNKEEILNSDNYDDSNKKENNNNNKEKLKSDHYNDSDDKNDNSDNNNDSNNNINSNTEEEKIINANRNDFDNNNSNKEEEKSNSDNYNDSNNKNHSNVNEINKLVIKEDFYIPSCDPLTPLTPGIINNVINNNSCEKFPKKTIESVDFTPAEIDIKKTSSEIKTQKFLTIYNNEDCANNELITSKLYKDDESKEKFLFNERTASDEILSCKKGKINDLKNEQVYKCNSFSTVEKQILPDSPITLVSNVSPESIKPLEDETPAQFLQRLKQYTPEFDIFKYVSKG